jgi:hypothetical protein
LGKGPACRVSQEKESLRTSASEHLAYDEFQLRTGFSPVNGDQEKIKPSKRLLSLSPAIIRLKSGVNEMT